MQALATINATNPLDSFLQTKAERTALGLSRIGIPQSDGSLLELRNSTLLPAYYLIPEEILKKCGQELYSLPRFFSLLLLDHEAIRTMESDLFINCIIDSYAYMVWPYLRPDIPYMEIFSGHEPSWKLAHAPSIWISELYLLHLIPTLREYAANPYSYIPYPQFTELDAIMSIAVPSAVERYNLQPVMDAAKEFRCFEDFDGRSSHQKTDFYRKWYHSRTQKAEFSFEGFQEQCKKYYDDMDWEIPDPLSSFEDEIGQKVDVDRFLKTLDEKDRQILQMRAEGYTNQEIANALGFKTHSAVIKRVRKIGEKYQKFSGLNFGF